LFDRTAGFLPPRRGTLVIFFHLKSARRLTSIS
jgi:hypothetical protein